MADTNEGASAFDKIAAKLGTGGPFGRRAEGPGEDDPALVEMRRNRKVAAKTAAANGAGGGGSSLSFATGRPRDPMFYWKQNNLPYDVEKHDEIKKIRAFCRLLYLTHPIIASCVDIYSKYPLLGSELVCKDEQLTDFYTDLFFSPEGLNYDKFLRDIGREYWTVGEAWPLGSFNEALGVWEDDELINPDDVEVERSPFLREPRFFIKLPETLREVITKRTPAYDYERLVSTYPELIHYAADGALMPVSNVLLQQIKFTADTFNKRGIPILMRAMRAVMQEEMLNAAQDAIADRLYTPLILARLGASATDLGTDVPWIPNDDDLASFEEALDQALAADFRVLVHHFGIQMESVFGRENMPDMGADFERLEDRMLQSFGLSRTMLTGASSGETYAADALNRDLVSQLLTTYQDEIANHYRQRALIVAEAQEHFDYEVRDGKRFVIMEEILEVDEETGEERIVEQPKLLIPELRFKTMNLSDDEGQRQFFEALRAAGVPISMKTRLVNAPIDLDEEMERTKEEQVQLAVAEQETRKAIFESLRDKGLPIPPDLDADFGAVILAEPAPGPQMMLPMLGLAPDPATPNFAPTPEDMMMTPPAGGTPMPGMETQPFGEQPGEEIAPSDEMRSSMPKPAALFQQAGRMRTIAKAHYEAPPELKTTSILNEDQEVIREEAIPDGIPRGTFATPKHVGMRKHLALDPKVPLGDA